MRRLAVLLLLLVGLAVASSVDEEYVDVYDGVVFEFEEPDSDEVEAVYGEGRTLLGSYPTPPVVEVAGRGVIVSPARCGVYWRQSRPRGSDWPNKAFRLGTRYVIETVCAEMGLVYKNSCLKRQAVLCRNGRIMPDGDLRKNVRNGGVSRVPPERQEEFVEKYIEHVRNGSWADKVCALLDQREVPLPKRQWCPKRAYPAAYPA